MDNKDETSIQEFESEWVDFNYAYIDKNKMKSYWCCSAINNLNEE